MRNGLFLIKNNFYFLFDSVVRKKYYRYLISSVLEHTSDHVPIRRWVWYYFIFSEFSILLPVKSELDTSCSLVPNTFSTFIRWSGSCLCQLKMFSLLVFVGSSTDMWVPQLIRCAGIATVILSGSRFNSSPIISSFNQFSVPVNPGYNSLLVTRVKVFSLSTYFHLRKIVNNFTSLRIFGTISIQSSIVVGLKLIVNADLVRRTSSTENMRQRLRRDIFFILVTTLPILCAILIEDIFFNCSRISIERALRL